MASLTEWIIASFLIGMLAGILMTGYLWIRSIDDLNRKHELDRGELMEELESEKANKESL